MVVAKTFANFLVSLMRLQLAAIERSHFPLRLLLSCGTRALTLRVSVPLTPTTLMMMVAFSPSRSPPIATWITRGEIGGNLSVKVECLEDSSEPSHMFCPLPLRCFRFGRALVLCSCGEVLCCIAL
ncbi:hypothetical protein DEO72_LG11g633 [Vigna unguiculata]|uniref:Uncharacterized protein n=1 Tax=Vigna unguiculata TaxID=3917 RepID=A0A4D6NJV1_VIGUN|nr:hypothetical protein DEO72_LG11g633 [Vigna unguiculata]